MNKYNARENWSLIKALGEGKLIQSRENIGAKWDDDVSPQWYDNRYYRVKPDKVEFTRGDEVLVRNDDTQLWKDAVYSFTDDNNNIYTQNGII